MSCQTAFFVVTLVGLVVADSKSSTFLAVTASNGSDVCAVDQNATPPPPPPPMCAPSTWCRQQFNGFHRVAATFSADSSVSGEPTARHSTSTRSSGSVTSTRQHQPTSQLFLVARVTSLKVGRVPNTNKAYCSKELFQTPETSLYPMSSDELAGWVDDEKKLMMQNTVMIDSERRTSEIVYSCVLV